MIKTPHNPVSPELNSPGDKPQLERRLQNRHIQLISIGGAIGVGLFMGSGKTISIAGTSILLVYGIIGFFLFFTMRAMGELLLSNLQFKSFADFCAYYLGGRAGFFIAWSYWLIWIVGVIGECIVVAEYSQYWFPGLPHWIPAVGSLLLLLGLNIMTVKLFGEIEYWFAIIKVVAIMALIGAGIYLVATAYVSPNGLKASLSHLTDRQAFMPHGIMGFLAGFQLAVFSFAGIELIGTTAAEAKNPERTLPRAINAVPIRILIFYVLSLACIICVTSWAFVDSKSSPFVQLFVMAGFPMAAGVVNFVVSTSALSSANSGVFSTSRMLYGLSLKNQSPKSFAVLNSGSVPHLALIFSAACMLAGICLIFLVPDFVVLFTFLSTISAILYIFVWSMILVSYVAYRRKQPQLNKTSVFRMPGGMAMAYACLAFFLFVIGLLWLEDDTRTGLVVMPLWFSLLYAAYWLVERHAGRGALAPCVSAERL